MAGLAVRVVTSASQCVDMEQVQERVWDRSVVMPAPHLLASIGAGGIVLGAYDGEGAVGFCWGFPAVRGGRTWFYSHMLGVLPGYRGRGLGLRLKLAQREAVLEAGHDLITWTFDPLRIGNAVLNLERLGAVAMRYVPDYYGQLADPLNRDLPTDRLLVHWHLTSERVMRRLSGRGTGALPPGTRVVNGPGPGPGGLPRSLPPDLGLTAPAVAVTVPSGLDRLKEADPGLARDWRLQTRRAFEHYLGSGYAATGIVAGDGVASYLLEAGWTDEDR